MTRLKLFEVVQRLNWLYGRGELVGIQKDGDSYRATAKKQYGFEEFRVRVVGKTVFARGHQQTVRD